MQAVCYSGSNEIKLLMTIKSNIKPHQSQINSQYQPLTCWSGSSVPVLNILEVDLLTVKIMIRWNDLYVYETQDCKERMDMGYISNKILDLIDVDMGREMMSESRPAHVFFTSPLNPCPLIWKAIHGPVTPIFSWDYRQRARICSNPSLCHSRADVDAVIIISIFQWDLEVFYVKQWESEYTTSEIYSTFLIPTI